MCQGFRCVGTVVPDDSIAVAVDELDRAERQLELIPITLRHCTGWHKVSAPGFRALARTAALSVRPQASSGDLCRAFVSGKDASPGTVGARTRPDDARAPTASHLTRSA